MKRVPPVVHAPITTAHDGFGRRTNGIDPESGDEVELLDLAPELVEHAGFVTTLAERVARFASVRHASYVHLRRVDRPAPDRLELVSDATPGWRLSELLIESIDAAVPLDITIVIALLRQLLPAVALYGRHNREAAIGSLAPERLIVTPQARLVIAEHAFGPAIEKLNMGRDRLWRDLRVCMPPSAGLPRANQRADANAIGVIALSLLLGRVLKQDEYPSQLKSLVEGMEEFRDGRPSPLSAPLASWLSRALQFDVRTAFQAPSDAQLAFETVLASDRSYVTTSAKLDAWVAQLGGAIDARRRPPGPEPAPEPPPPPDPVAIAAPIVEEPIAPVASQAPPIPPPEAPAPLALDASDVRKAPRSRLPLLAAGAVIGLLLVAVGYLATRETGGLRDGDGELVVQTRAPGAAVTIDGKPSGVTPLTVSLSSGAHVIEVKIGNGEPRVVPVMIRAGMQTAQYVELPEPLLPSKPPAEKSRKR